MSMIPKSALEALNKLVELAEKCTPGPWRACLGSGEHLMTGIHSDAAEGLIADFCPPYFLEESYSQPRDEEWTNIQFTCAARNAIPALKSILQSLEPTEARAGEVLGSSVCPICGVDAPHYHPPEVVAEHYKYVSVPWNPTEAQWGGLARAIVMWMDMSDGPKLPRDLLKHLERSGQEIPQWLRDEGEMQDLDHSMSKGSRAVLIYKAMLAASPVTKAEK